MPYWTMNSMAVSAADLNVLLNAEGNLDFNLVRPMPAGLDITEGGLRRRAIKTAEARRCGDAESLAQAAEDARPPATNGFRGEERYGPADDLADLGEEHPWNAERYGFPSWWCWTSENWGTIFNAFDTCVERYGGYAVVSFRTAWSEPDHVMLADLAYMCSMPIWYEYANEDFDGIHAIHAIRFDNDGFLYEEQPSCFLLDAVALDDERPERLRAVGGLYDEQTIALHLQPALNGYDDDLLERKWLELADVPIDYGDPEHPDGKLEAAWFVFDAGDDRIEDVWRWFDERYPGGVAALVDLCASSAGIKLIPAFPT